MAYSARMIVENPGQLVMTLKVSMTMDEWEKLRSQLDTAYPGWKLSRSINDMLSVARKTFYPNTESTTDDPT